MTFNEFKTLIRPDNKTTENDMLGWYRYAKVGGWVTSLISHKLKYEVNDISFKDITLEEYKELEKIFYYFNKIVKYEDKLNKLYKDFE
jgi:hypothetical protein